MPRLTSFSKQFSIISGSLLGNRIEYDSLLLDNASYNEGDTVGITLQTTNAPAGTSVNYTVTGISAADASKISGTLTIDLDGNASDSFTLTEDILTEGNEIFTVILNATDNYGASTGSISASATIIDTSLSPTYTLSTSNSVVNETSTGPFTITLTTTNVPNGTDVPYSILPPPSGSPITQDDLLQGSLTGVFTINNNTGTQVFEMAEDSVSEGAEIIYIALDNGEDTIQITVGDTSLYPVEWYDIATDALILSETATQEGISGENVFDRFNFRSLYINRPPGDYTNVFPQRELSVARTSGQDWTLDFWVDDAPFTQQNQEYPLMTIDDGSGVSPEFITIGVYPNATFGGSGRIGLEYGTYGGSTTRVLTTRSMPTFDHHLSLTWDASLNSLELHSGGTRINTINGLALFDVARIIFGGRGTVANINGPAASLQCYIGSVVFHANDTGGIEPFSPYQINSNILMYAVGREVLPTNKVYSVYATDDFTQPTEAVLSAVDETGGLSSVYFAVVCQNVVTDNGNPITVNWSITGVSLDDIATIDGVVPTSLSGTMDIVNLDAPSSYVGNFIEVQMAEDYTPEGAETMTFQLNGNDSEGDTTGSPLVTITVNDTSSTITEANLFNSFGGGQYVGTYTNTNGDSYHLVHHPAAFIPSLGDFELPSASVNNTVNDDGVYNTQQFLGNLNSSFPILINLRNNAQSATGLSDWYLPSRAEQALMWRLHSLAFNATGGTYSSPDGTAGYSNTAMRSIAENETSYVSSTEFSDLSLWVNIGLVDGFTVSKNNKDPFDFTNDALVYYGIRRIPTTRTLTNKTLTSGTDYVSAEVGFNPVDLDELCILFTLRVPDHLEVASLGFIRTNNYGTFAASADAWQGTVVVGGTTYNISLYSLEENDNNVRYSRDQQTSEVGFAWFIDTDNSDTIPTGQSISSMTLSKVKP